MLTQTIISVSLCLIFMLECARLYLGLQGNLKEKVKYIFIFMDDNSWMPTYNFLLSKCLFLCNIDSGFSSILDVFIDPSTTVTIIILIAEHHAGWNGCTRRNVSPTSGTARFWVCGSSRHGETSQASFSYIPVLRWPTQQNRLNTCLNWKNRKRGTLGFLKNERFLKLFNLYTVESN